MRKFVVVAAVCVAAALGGLAFAAGVPSQAQAATNQHFWSGSVPSKTGKYTLNPSGTLQYASRSWMSIYNNGGPWRGAFPQTNGVTPVLAIKTGSPVAWSYSGSYSVAAGCINEHHSFTIIANCWTNFGA